MSTLRALRAAGLIAACAALVPMLGCGGSGSGAAGRTATVEFNIRWPEGSSRTIPTGTNRFVVFVNGDGMATQAYIVDVPGATNQTYKYRVPVAPGTKRLFAAVARQVATTKYGSLTPVAIDSADLKDGTVLGSGIDPQPYDIVPTGNTTANVEIQLPGQPGDELSDVTTIINQILTPTFPSVAILEIFRDDQGRPITNINVSNLEVIEDGIPAVVTDVRTVVQAGQPLSIALVLDRSGSMSGQRTTDLENAASTFVSLMQANDAGEVIDFASSVTVSQAFTTDKSLLQAAIAAGSAGGVTALYDGTLQGVVDTAARGGRMAVLTMTDGYENASSHTRDDVVNAAKAGGVPVFAIGLGSVEPNLPDLATLTGGFYYAAPTSSDLNDIYQKISGQLSGQLQISFISPDPFKKTPPKTRNIEVRLTYGAIQRNATSSYSM